jgi:hypothetical protein
MIPAGERPTGRSISAKATSHDRAFFRDFLHDGSSRYRPVKTIDAIEEDFVVFG